MTLRVDQTGNTPTQGNHAADHVATNIKVNELETRANAVDVTLVNKSDKNHTHDASDIVFPQQPVYRRGINLSGAEFGDSTFPGVHGTDYRYPKTASIQYMATRGHRVVRLPFRWERIQPTQGAALDTAELALLRAAVEGILITETEEVIIEPHNYARRKDGVERILGTPELPIADFVDVWQRLSTAFKDTAGVSYGLMNEPHDMPAVLGSFSGSTIFDWPTDEQGWTSSSTLGNSSGRLSISKDVSGSWDNLQADSAGQSLAISADRKTLRFKITPNAAVTGNWKAFAKWQNASFTWTSITDCTTVMYRADTNEIVSSLVSDVEHYVESLFATALPTDLKSLGFQIEADTPPTQTAVFYIDDFQHGNLTGAVTPTQHWELASTQAYNAIRANGDTHDVYVSFDSWGHGYSLHSAPWITGAVYELHLYFDDNESGQYLSDFATNTAAAVTRGYDTLEEWQLAKIDGFYTWLNGQRGFVGEIGWPDEAAYNNIGLAVYTRMDQHQIGSTYWAAGDMWDQDYPLLAYKGDPVGTAEGQAAIIEQFPSLYRTAGAIEVKNGGVSLTQEATEIDFVGGNVTNVGSKVTVNLPHMPKITVGLTDEFQFKANAITAATTINQAIDYLDAFGTGGVIEIGPGLFTADTSIILKERIYLKGQGQGATIITAKDGLNADVVVTDNFYSETNHDWIGYDSRVKFAGVSDMEIRGNSSNQSASGETDPALMNGLVKIYGYKMNCSNLMLRDAKEVGFYSEFSNHQPPIFEDYETLPSMFYNIDLKGFGQYGIVNRGPHDSYWSHCFAATDGACVASIFVEQGANFSVAGVKMDRMYGNGDASVANIWIKGNPSIEGTFYAEGSSVAAFDISGSMSELNMEAGYTPIGYIIRGDSGNASRNKFNMRFFYDEPGTGVKLDGNIQSNKFYIEGGNPDSVVFNTADYTGGNNDFKGRVGGATFFSDESKISTPSDLVEIQDDRYPDWDRRSIWQFPMGGDYARMTNDGWTNMKFEPQTLHGTPWADWLEYDGTDVYMTTHAGTRYKLNALDYSGSSVDGGSA